MNNTSNKPVAYYLLNDRPVKPRVGGQVICKIIGHPRQDEFESTCQITSQILWVSADKEEWETRTHITSLTGISMVDEDLVVTYKGVPKFRLNARLVAQKNLSSDEVATIKALHQERLSLEGRMAEDSRDLKLLYSWWLENQRALQLAWKFEQNDNFIRFWEVPQCTCPKMDCEDAYPTGYYTVNSDCPVHGD